MRITRGLLIVLLLSGCGSADETDRQAMPNEPHFEQPTAPPESSSVAAEPTPAGPDQPSDQDLNIGDPSEPFDVPLDIPAGSLRLDPAQRRTAPSGICIALTAPGARIWPSDNLARESRGASVVRAMSSGFVVAGYAKGVHGLQVFAVRVSPEGQSRPLFTASLAPAAAPHRARLPRVPPGLAILGDRLLLAWLDGAHARAAQISSSGRAQITDVGEGADRRFSPAAALHARGGLVAYTDGTGTPMRVRLARIGLEGGVESRADLTPRGMGAAAPVFAAGATTTPELYFLEPRSGTSALYRVRFEADLTPSVAEVVRPIASVYEPPRIAVVASSPGVVAYTALGNAATTAVGLVPLGDASAPPVALLPGTGFGVLGLDAVALPGAAVFAFDAPRSSGTSAPAGTATWHNVRVRVAGAVAAPFTLDSPSDSPSIAASPNGLIALTYSAPGGVYLSWLSCTP